MKVERSLDVIDAAGGNVGSLCRALDRLGVEYGRVNGANRPIPLGRRPVILPGVGAFGAVMNNLKQSGLDSEIKQVIKDGVPFLGICVGLQVLFQKSEESPGVEGLSVLPGEVVKFGRGKVPQIGWNRVQPCSKSSSAPWPAGFAYFVNSFYAVPEEPDAVLFQSNYFQPFCAAVQKDNVTAFQFHPEKSGEFGMTLLARWLENASV